MGDLNADGSYFNEDSSSDLDAYYWVIDDSQDTTTSLQITHMIESF